LTVANGTSNSNRTISFTVPAGASLGTAGIRVRFTSTTTSSPTGAVGRGEVEDYITTISDPITLDYGDFSGFGIASSTANNAIRLGAAVDAEASAHNNSTATGDDLAGTDDEDGIIGPTSIARDENVNVTATVTNTTAAAAYLNAWIDFNRNGVLTDAGEQIATNILVSAGTTNAARNISFTVPSGASIGTAGVRFRLTSTMTPGPTGQSGTGEVEDYTVNITTAPHVAIGNMVYIDANQDRWYNWGEGVGGVTVQLMNSSHAVVATTTTSTIDPGYYLFNNVVPGNYYVRIPASEFASGRPLHGKLNVAGWNVNHPFDDGGVGGDDHQEWVAAGAGGGDGIPGEEGGGEAQAGGEAAVYGTAGHGHQGPGGAVAHQHQAGARVAAGQDLLRTQWWYAHTSFGSLQFDYPSLAAIARAYVATALALAALDFALSLRDASPRTSPQEPLPIQEPAR
jgi:hypothetical protein